MNAEGILIAWVALMAFAIVVVLVEAMRGDEQARADNTRPTDECGAFLIEAKDNTGPEFRKAFEEKRALAKELPDEYELDDDPLGAKAFRRWLHKGMNKNKEGTDGKTNLRED